MNQTIIKNNLSHLKVVYFSLKKDHSNRILIKSYSICITI